MEEAIGELLKLREYYRMHGKTLQAHVIKTAIEKLRKYAREQKAKEEVQTEVGSVRPLDVRASVSEPDGLGAQPQP